MSDLVPQVPIKETIVNTEERVINMQIVLHDQQKQLNELKEAMHSVLVILHGAKGFIGFLVFVGKLAKWTTAITTAIVAIWVIIHAWRTGEMPGVNLH